VEVVLGLAQCELLFKAVKMSTSWQLQEAKNRFSKVVDMAMSGEVQEITRHGKKAAVVLSFDEFKRLKGHKDSLVDFLHKSPLKNIDISRPKDAFRYDLPLKTYSKSE
jgi:prevent-host-death family protein